MISPITQRSAFDEVRFSAAVRTDDAGEARLDQRNQSAQRTT